MLNIPVIRVPQSGSLVEKNWKLELAEVGLGSPFQEEHGVLLDLDCFRVQKNILARGTVQAHMALQCDLCLVLFEKTAKSDFLIEFVTKNETADDQVDDDPNICFLTDGKIPLGEELRQELELCLPLRSVCSDSCKGLCLLCGINRNQNECDCEIEFVHRPLHGLKNLFNTED